MATRRSKKRLEPRKIPSQSRSADTVNAILEAAALILEKDGFQGYDTNHVATKAGISIGSLYQYFPNKEAITKALIARETAPMIAAFSEVPSAPSLREGVLQLVRAAVTHQLSRPALARILDFEQARLTLITEVNHNMDVGSASLEALLVKFGATRKAATRIATQDILAIVRGIVDMAGERGERDARSLETRVANAAFGYLIATKLLNEADFALSKK